MRATNQDRSRNSASPRPEDTASIRRCHRTPTPTGQCDPARRRARLPSVPPPLPEVDESRRCHPVPAPGTRCRQVLRRLPGTSSAPPPLPSAVPPVPVAEEVEVLVPSPHRRRRPGHHALWVGLVCAFSTLFVCGSIYLACWSRLGGEWVEPAVKVEPPPDPVTRVEPLRSPRPNPSPKPVVVPDEPEDPRLAIYQTKALPPSALEASKRIDDLVFGKLRAEGIAPAAPCSDAVFVRRVYLDVIGRIPTAAEARTFLAERSPDRRERLIDHLLDRQEFADYWTMKWSDILRIKSEFPINLWPNGAQAYHRWIRTALRENMPYDQFARALLTTNGSNFREPAVNFYRAVQRKEATALAHTVAQTFMGVRPEGWSSEQWAGMAPFFSQVGYKATREWKEEIVYFDPRKPRLPSATFPDGTPASFLPDQDPREVFTNWLIRPENPWFARNIANRMWAWLLGRGIIHEVDDVRPDNPPSHPELLTGLERELVRSGYDLKHLMRAILNSRTYQLSSVPASGDPRAVTLFAHYPVRRLEAEVLIDAICQVTGTTERYSSPIPEPFTYIPEGTRSVALPDGSITSSFLEMFGRPPRDTGLVSERNNTLTPGQRLHLLNSAHIQNKVEQGPGLAALYALKRKPDRMVEELYLTILSRYPTADEREAAENHCRSGGTGRPAEVDIAWALMNTAEFLCRH